MGTFDYGNLVLWEPVVMGTVKIPPMRKALVTAGVVSISVINGSH